MAVCLPCYIIDGGMSPLLQFMDTHMNKPFKNGFAEKWTEWIAEGEEKYTASGNRQKASYEQVVKWYTMYGTWLLRTILSSKVLDNVGTSILMVITTNSFDSPSGRKKPNLKCSFRMRPWQSLHA